MELEVILSGFLGAFLGGLLSCVGAVAGSILATGAALYMQRRAERLEEREWQARVVRSLLAEVRDNINIAILKSNAVETLLADSWQIHKGQLSFLPMELQEQIRTAYGLVLRVNVLSQAILFAHTAITDDPVLGSTYVRVHDEALQCLYELEKALTDPTF